MEFYCTGRTAGLDVTPCQDYQEMTEAQAHAHYEATDHDCEQRHSQDSDCTVESETECCSGCGVYHGDPCPTCGGHAFHLDGCEENAPWQEA